MPEEERKSDEVALTKVVTATEDAFVLPNGDIVNTQMYLVWLGNEVIKIRKGIA